jgi:hypothetical protein
MNVAATHFDGIALNWYCPGCKKRHGVTVKPRGDVIPWEWNGDLEKPTLSPSVLVNGMRGNSSPEWDAANPRCHSFMREGKLEFLGDCEHELAGQTVDMVEWIPGPRDSRP